MPYLEWIDDEKLIYEVEHLINIAKVAKENSETKFRRNVIDPFSALFQITGFHLDFETWIQSEKTRQAQHSLQNHIGNFHQNILGNAHGWKDLKVGGNVDLLCEEKKIIAEVKNKHNTVKGSDKVNSYKSLEKLVMPNASIYKGYTAYYVTIIPKKPERFNLPFTPSDKEVSSKCPVNEKIREIDGASFYSLVTGDHYALHNLYKVLPEVIQKCKGGILSNIGKEQLMKFFEHAFGADNGF